MSLHTAKQAIRRQGPCLLCGGPYAAHRMVDAQMEQVAAGDSIDAVAADYGLTVASMIDIWRAYVAVLTEGSA